MPERERDWIGECSIVQIIGMIAFSIFLIVNINTFDGEYLGTLVRADKYNNNYVKEIFQKDNTTNTCAIIRPREYYTVHEANDAKDKVILGTTRKIWSHWHQPHSCYDQSKKKSDQLSGIVLLGMFAGFPFLLVIYVLSIRVWKKLSRLYPNFNFGFNCFPRRF
jgi:hypothetical protein